MVISAFSFGHRLVIAGSGLSPLSGELWVGRNPPVDSSGGLVQPSLLVNNVGVSANSWALQSRCQRESRGFGVSSAERWFAALFMGAQRPITVLILRYAQDRIDAEPAGGFSMTIRAAQLKLAVGRDPPVDSSDK